MCRIFLFEPTRLDIKDLKRFGDIAYVFNDGENRRALKDERLEEQVLSQLSRFLFDPEEDYIAIVGQQVPTSIFLTAVVGVYGEIKTLVFEPQSRTYYERRMGHSEKRLKEAV